MKAAQFDYARAREVPEVLRMLAERPGAARVLAGGQSLGPMLNLRLARPQLLIDLSRIESLCKTEDTGKEWRLGAAVTHARIEDSRARLRGAEMLSDVAFGIAHRSIRNRGTIGGSVAHADPAADWPVALAAHGASVNLRSTRGLRRLAVEQFVLGAFRTALADDEIVESIDVPKLGSGARYGYYKFSRKTGDFAEVCAAAVFDPQAGVAKIFLGALVSAPLALSSLARDVASRGHIAVSPDTIAAALAAAAPDLDPIERRMAAGTVRRTLDQLFKP
jgi:aerobic carbon-monoxide dehydrogenase medium subunit